MLTWRMRIQMQPRLAEMAAWPSLDPALIPKQRRGAYLRNTRIVSKVLKGERLATVAKAEGLSAGRVTQLLNRCLGGPAEAPPALWQGLVPHQVLPTDAWEASGRGRFAQLLQQVPGLRAGLDEMLLARLKDKPWAEVPSPATYHALFKNLLAQANWPLDTYPYTTASLAYESVRRDLKTRWVFFCQARKSRRKAFKTKPTVSSDRRLYDRIEIDEQIVDCEQSTAGIELNVGEGLPPLRLSRLTLLTAIDAATDCILGFQLALTRHPQQDDLLALLQQCVTRWPPRELATEGLELPVGAGFPNTMEGLPLPLPREIALDNAWMHHAQSVELFATQELGATLSFGRPRSPTVRRIIETTFARLNHRLSHRLASTTGSSVTDPKRESPKNRKQVPMMSLPSFEDALYVMLAETNHRPRPHLAAATPLDAVRYQAGNSYLVSVDDHQRSLWNPFRGLKEVVVHDRADPKRKPYVNFEYLRYKGAGLLAVPASESKVLVAFDRRDVRYLEVSRLNGQVLGTLYCPGSWLFHPHSIATRRHLWQKCRQLIRASLDPLTDYLHQQRNQLNHPTEVAQFLRTYQEFVGGFGLPTSLWPRTLSGPEGRIDSKTTAPTTPVPKPGKTSGQPTRRRYWSLQLNPGGQS